MATSIDRLAADLQPEEYEVMRPEVNGGRSVGVRGRTGELSFEVIKVGFGTLYRVRVDVGAGAAITADETCKMVIAMLEQAGRLVPAADLDPESILEKPTPATV